jgi:hypothetical protein
MVLRRALALGILEVQRIDQLVDSLSGLRLRGFFTGAQVLER